MAAHARQEAPRECCGLLVGAGSRVELAVPMANVAKTPRTAFRIDPAEHIAVRRVLRQVVPASAIVGVYHSHPKGPATPSPRDIAESHYPDWLFVIVGSAGRSVRAFRIQDQRATAVAIRWRGGREARRR
jgi:proteasome lid subunit RPN8/RPN11